MASCFVFYQFQLFFDERYVCSENYIMGTCKRLNIFRCWRHPRLKKDGIRQKHLSYICLITDFAIDQLFYLLINASCFFTDFQYNLKLVCFEK